ncbi:MAG: hypothetical protein PHQ66_01820 [Candidatus Nanoarchaeia archaeon]|nr:hypothetical protein [Candidatus Nanoarchaeia archaeon]MDD5357888.1 hypothetical protein [Candidatus Nanoarchaeia archaeon]MDD5588807.1 hypothetical protein [Candidatus Nanoarchaeia archaeon]
MGVIKGLLVVVSSGLLFLSLLSMTFFLVSSSSLKYENLQESASSVVIGFLEDTNVTSVIDENYYIIQRYCNISNDTSTYVFKEGNYTFEISCDSVAQGKNAMIEEGINSIISKIYYTEYDCSFFNCLKQSPFFLISEKAYNYLDAKFYFFLLTSFLLIVALFIFTEKKSNTFIVAGILTIIPALLFIKIDSVLAVFSDKMLFRILGIFFSESFAVSTTILVAGIVLLVLGVIFKVFKIGFKIQEIISKFKKPETPKPEQKSGKKRKRR